MNLTPEQHNRLMHHMEQQAELDSLHGKLVFCYIMIAGLGVTIAALLYLWPH